MPSRAASADTRPRRRPGRLTLGLCLVGAGLALLGYAGWSLVGSTWVAERRYDDTVTALQRAWERGDARVVETEQGTASAVVRIPRFGDDWAVPLLEGVDDDALASGIGHYPGTAAPGQIGNVALAGHRITHGEPLRDMPSLETGDEIVLETGERVYTYRLLTPGDGLTVPFTEGWVVDDPPVDPDGAAGPPLEGRDRLLTLTTCSELFHTDDRLVAFARLVDTAPR